MFTVDCKGQMENHYCTLDQTYQQVYILNGKCTNKTRLSQKWPPQHAILRVYVLYDIQTQRH